MSPLEELKKRFEKFDERLSTKSRNIPSDFKKASVLIPLFWKEGEWRFLLTERTMHLRSHAGSVAFPGGKQEDCDVNEVAAALREAEEEVGLKPKNVQIIAVLPPSYINYKIVVTPVLAVIPSDFVPRLNVNEVDRVFDLPLSRFLKSDFSINRLLFHGKYINVYYFADKCDEKTAVTYGFTAMLCIMVAVVAKQSNMKMEFVEGVVKTKEDVFEYQDSFLKIILKDLENSKI